MNTQELRAELAAQGTLKPGESGWWKVWGASVCDIRPGDAVGFRSDPVDTDSAEWHFVEDTFQAKSWPIRWGIVEDGERYTLGALCPIVLLRKGDRNTLSGSVR